MSHSKMMEKYQQGFEEMKADSLYSDKDIKRELHSEFPMIPKNAFRKVRLMNIAQGNLGNFNRLKKFLKENLGSWRFNKPERKEEEVNATRKASQS